MTIVACTCGALAQGLANLLMYSCNSSLSHSFMRWRSPEVRSWGWYPWKLFSILCRSCSHDLMLPSSREAYQCWVEPFKDIIIALSIATSFLLREDITVVHFWRNCLWSDSPSYSDKDAGISNFGGQSTCSSSNKRGEASFTLAGNNSSYLFCGLLFAYASSSES
jgi:hypothetical protein